MASVVDERILTQSLSDLTSDDHQTSELWEGSRESNGQRERVIRAASTTTILEAHPTHIRHPQSIQLYDK